MTELVKSCPLCGSQCLREFDSTVFRSHLVFYQICADCGFVFQSPRMTSAEQEAFYAQEYRQVYQGDQGPVQKDLKIQQGRAESLLAIVKEQVPVVKRHLDIGCSAGILLDSFARHFGCLSVGVEPGDSYRAYAKAQGLRVYARLADVTNQDPAGFDLISLAHVLEHIPQPVPYLVELRQRYLNDNGSLLIEVPNLYCHDSFEVAHMSAFSQHSLAQVLRKAGFVVILNQKHGKPRSDMLPLHLTVLARSQPSLQNQPVVPEKFVRLKHFGGLLSRRMILRLFPAKSWKTFQ